MEVILLVDVKNVGKKNQTVKVSDGYANNYLLKNKLAVPVSKKSVEILETQKENARIAQENAKKDAIALSETLKNITLEFTAKVGKDSKLFGSISLKQVEEELKNKHGITIDKRKFIDKGPLDMLGMYKLRIELFKGVIGEIKVHISGRE
ncbi:MAG: 50S ribosomal protein L9 [Bacilli bacterium]|nr:50S ribosomal protein L9 [Bacilli bacterium]